MRSLRRLAKPCFILLTIGLFSYSSGNAQSEIHRTENWITNSTVAKLEHSNGYTMLSGFFSTVGPYSGHGVITDATTGAVDLTIPKVHGDIYVSTPDGNGGWYIGGYFDAVDTVSVTNLAHIRADKTVDRNWKPNPNNTPSELTVSGNTLYVGGYFTNISGQTRNRIASFNIPTGNLNAWNPGANGSVESIEVFGSLVYAGGYFTTIGGQARNGLAALNATTGVPAAWAPSISGTFSSYVKATAIDPVTNTIYIGGNFTTVGGLPRLNLARLNLTTGTVTTFWAANTNATGYIEDIALLGNSLFVGGSFTSINGITRNSIAAVSAVSGLVLTWNTTLTAFDFVQDLAISGNTLYFAGFFDFVNGNIRTNVAAVDVTTAALQPWAPIPNGSVRTISGTSANVFFGGDFNGMNWEQRSDGFALFDDTTNEAWPFSLDLNGGSVYTIAVRDNTLYIGGQFQAVNKSVRRNLAALDLTTGEVLPWNPSAFGLSPTDPDAYVLSMKIRDNLLYVGGKFLRINAITRPGLAAIDLNTGAVNNWNPVVGSGTNTSEVVNSIDIDNNTVYVGGSFIQISGNTRPNLAAIDATSGLVLPWNPTSSGPVQKIRVSQNAAYVLGVFDNGVGGQIRLNRVAALNLTSNTATPWNPDLRNGFANDITLSSSSVYVGGYFDGVGSQPRPGLASFSLTNLTLDSWIPDVGSNSDGQYDITTLSSSPYKLHVGGGFDLLGKENRTNYGEYCVLSPTITPTGSTLTASPAGSYQWYQNDVPINGATSSTVDINQLEYGVYAVEISANGCTGRAEFTYLITEAEVSNDNEVKVYPNPVQGDLSVQIPSSAGAVNFTFMDMTGRSIKRIQGNGVEHQLSIRELDSGPYLLVIEVQGKKRVRKIIKVN